MGDKTFHYLSTFKQLTWWKCIVT